MAEGDYNSVEGQVSNTDGNTPTTNVQGNSTEKASAAPPQFATTNWSSLTDPKKGVLKTDYQVWQYPAELATSRFPHYVMFFINANAKAASIANESAVEGVKSKSAEMSMTDAGRQSGAAVGAAPGGGGPLPEIATTFKRTSHAIALYMPPGIQTSYNMQYEESGANFMGNALIGSLDKIMGSKGGTRTSAGIMSDVVGVIPGVMEAEARQVARVGAAALGGGEGTIVGITGKAENPRTESIYKSTQLRSHTFEFTFMPKDADESQVVNDIITLFKIHMHPELQSRAAGNGGVGNLDGAYLVTPNQFDIEFHNEEMSESAFGGENTRIHKVGTSVLESMSVNYSGAGQWLAYAGTNDPVHIHLSLTFKEIEPLTRQMVAQGF